MASLAREGGLGSTLWAGPEVISRAMKRGAHPVQGGPRKEPVHLHLGFAGDHLSYAIDLGLPIPIPGPVPSAFSLDPEIKRECIWTGAWFRPSGVVIDRRYGVAKVRGQYDWQVVTESMPAFESIFTHIADPRSAPEVFVLREQIHAWRFYDHFRTDSDSMIRQPQLGTRTPVLSHSGHDLAAAVRTIQEVGNINALNEAVSDAFPEAELSVSNVDGRFTVEMRQHGRLRPLSAAELSDGTLRYICWIAALLTPRPPMLMVLNEPETSLHPDLLPALARLIGQAARHTQVMVVSHAPVLIEALSKQQGCCRVALEKPLGETVLAGVRELDLPPWHWPPRNAA